MKTGKTGILVAIITVLLAWILMAYQVPDLIAHQSKLAEVFGRYSLWYFVILLGYLSILLVLATTGIWLIIATRTDGFAERFDSFLSNKQNYALLGLLLVWLSWILVYQNLFIPAKAAQGINSALSVFSISVLWLITPSVKLDTGFLLSHILIPLGVLSFYLVPLMFLLPEGVNKTFATQSARIFIPVTIVSFILYFAVLGIRKTKPQVFSATKEVFYTSDLVLPLFPLTPVEGAPE